MSSAYYRAAVLHNRITKLFCNYTYGTLQTAINYLSRLERYAERNNMIDVADHAQFCRLSLSRKLEDF